MIGRETELQLNTINTNPSNSRSESQISAEARVVVMTLGELEPPTYRVICKVSIAVMGAHYAHMRLHHVAPKLNFHNFLTTTYSFQKKHPRLRGCFRPRDLDSNQGFLFQRQTELIPLLPQSPLSLVEFYKK